MLFVTRGLLACRDMDGASDGCMFLTISRCVVMSGVGIGESAVMVVVPV
jgi:hypothetical protein